LVARLSEGLANIDGDMATAYTRADGALRAQPVFCLMRTSLRDNLNAFISSGERKTGLFATKHRSAKVEFDDSAAFANANTLAELASLQSTPQEPI
jgi:molybdopterin-guanine dinucleotide biosynthesis protein A